MACMPTYSYDPETGVVSRHGCHIAAMNGPIGFKRDGYLRASFRGSRNILVHRIAWFLHYGEWPAGEVDHINGNGMDNRLCNLRLVTRAQNNANRPLKAKSSCGYRGVTRKPSGKFVANFAGHTHLGTFSTAREAHIAWALEFLDRYGSYANFGD